jgi:phosphate transport system substrate-binding protein
LFAIAAGKILHLPTVMGAVVVSYTLPGVETLRFDGPTLANIFLGKITSWDDPAITGQNPGVKLPDRDITVVHRSDASGTSYIFTGYLSAVSPEWNGASARMPRSIGPSAWVPVAMRASAPGSRRRPVPSVTSS